MQTAALIVVVIRQFKTNIKRHLELREKKSPQISTEWKRHVSDLLLKYPADRVERIKSQLLDMVNSTVYKVKVQPQNVII